MVVLNGLATGARSPDERPFRIRRDPPCGRIKRETIRVDTAQRGLRLTDPEWALIKPLLTEPGSTGRPWKHELRRVLDVILHWSRISPFSCHGPALASGIKWPADFIRASKVIE